MPLLYMLTSRDISLYLSHLYVMMNTIQSFCSTFVILALPRSILTSKLWVLIYNKTIFFTVTTLQTKKFLTFPDQIADNILNKCTFINTTFARYKLSGAFQTTYRTNAHLLIQHLLVINFGARFSN